MTTITVAVSKLVHSPRNIRRPSEDDDTSDMEATILSPIGLINPLTAHPMPRGRYGVMAGGRRLLALQRLIKRGDLPKDHAIDVTVRDESDAILDEISLVENVQRVALPAVTEYEAFARLIESEGATIEEVAHRYQITELHVRQRLKRGATVPTIDRASVTVRAESYDDQCVIIDLVTSACSHRVGAFAGSPRATVLTWGRGPDMWGPADSFEQAQDFRVTFDKPVS